MGKNESRSERKKTQKSVQTENKSGLSKVYYWIIGGLFLILFLLVVYIFAKSGNQVNLGEEEETSSIVQEKETKETDTDEADEKEESTEEIDETNEEDEDDQETTDEEESKDETTEDETIVDEDAPLDTDHAVDYSSGSADRVAIRNKVMQATGLGNDLIESWVGNNGPGRVTADVHNPDQSEVYRVYLQYGDSEWHVTNYESLSSVPND